MKFSEFKYSITPKPEYKFDENELKSLVEKITNMTDSLAQSLNFQGFSPK